MLTNIDLQLLTDFVDDVTRSEFPKVVLHLARSRKLDHRAIKTLINRKARFSLELNKYLEKIVVELSNTETTHLSIASAGQDLELRTDHGAISIDIYSQIADGTLERCFSSVTPDLSRLAFSECEAKAFSNQFKQYISVNRLTFLLVQRDNLFWVAKYFLSKNGLVCHDVYSLVSDNVDYTASFRHQFVVKSQRSEVSVTDPSI